MKIDPGNVNATLYRWILGVNVPKFMGKLNQAIKDMEYIQRKYGQNKHLYLVADYYLSIGYLKNNEKEKAKSGFKFIILYGKDSQYYESAKQEYAKLVKKIPAKETKDSEDFFKKAMDCLNNQDYQEAVENFRMASKQDSSNLKLHLLYARALGNLAQQGYTDKIYKDVTNRAAIAHEVYKVLSHCVELAPNDDEVRFLRASVGVNLSFFVNCLDEVTLDLTNLSKKGKTAKIQSEAKYYLKKAIEKKKVYDLAEKGFKEKSEAERKKLLSQFIPAEKFTKPEKPAGKCLQINLKLGYRDQIAPQTAVWIEDENENYIATIYVSGFAAHVKEKQMNLPRWAENSKFRKMETVTGASINCGEHQFYWDFTNYNGEKFNSKKFIVKAEICYWPHVQYLNQSMQVDLNKNTEFYSNGDNYLIPELTVKVISN